MKCYGYPPFTSKVMLQVVQNVRMEKAEVLLVVPDWPGQAWHQELLLMADRVHRLPAGVPLFASGALGGVFSVTAPQVGGSGRAHSSRGAAAMALPVRGGVLSRAPVMREPSWEQ